MLRRCCLQTGISASFPSPHHSVSSYDSTLCDRHNQTVACEPHAACPFLTNILHIKRAVIAQSTSYELNDQGVGVRVPVGARTFTSPCCPEWLWGPPSLLSNGYRGALSPGVKRPGREADHSSPTSAEVNKTWVYTSTSPYVFMA
jgi:hypothetical protein